MLHESVNLGFSASRLAVAHWEFIYLPLALIYRIIPSIPLLLYIQTLVLACGVFPIYQFAQKKLSSELIAFFIATAYLFYPALHGSNLFDLHGLTFSTTFLLFTFYYLDQGSQIKTIIFAVLSICCREDVAFIIFMIGLYNGIIKKQWKISAILLSLSIVWLISFLIRGNFTEHAKIAHPTNITSYWDFFTTWKMSEFLTTPFKTSGILLHSLFNAQNIKYIAKLVFPVMGFCFLSPSVLSIALPALLLNLLSDRPYMHQIEYHYTATITPFVFLATIQGLVKLKRLLTRFPKIKIDRLLIMIGSIIMIASVVSTTQFSILRFYRTWKVSEANKLLSNKLQQIPSELSVSTTARPGPHAANRRDLYHFPDHAANSDIIILELNKEYVEIKKQTGKQPTTMVLAMNDLTQSIFRDTTLGLRFVEDNVFCLQRGLDPLTSFRKYAIKEDVPEHLYKSEKIELEHGLTFLGWEPVYIGRDQAHLKLYWLNAKKQSKGTDLEFYLTSDEWIEKIPHRPIFGRINIENWSHEKVICDHLFINKPIELKEDRFSVKVNFSTSPNIIKHHLFTFQFLK